MKYFGAKISKIEQKHDKWKAQKRKKVQKYHLGGSASYKKKKLNKKANKKCTLNLRHTVGQNWGKVQKPP